MNFDAEEDIFFFSLLTSKKNPTYPKRLTHDTERNFKMQVAI